MTARAAIALVGRCGLWCPVSGGSLRFAVTIEDVRTSYGQQHYQVSPVAGTGRRWVMAEAVTLEDAKPSMVSGPRELTA